MGKNEIHFYPEPIDNSMLDKTCVTWVGTVQAIEDHEKVIHTTQMGLLCYDLMDQGYRIFLHENETVHEFVIGDNRPVTMKDMNKAHNLFKMWRAGGFTMLKT